MVVLATKTQAAAAAAHPNGRYRAALASLSESERQLLEEALQAPLDYIPNRLFRRPSAETTLFDAGLELPPANTGWYHPMIEDGPLTATAPSSSLLNGAEEKHLFLRYNYARRRTGRLVKCFRTHPGKRLARQILLWYRRVRETRDLITSMNLALVLAMAKRVRMADVDFGELISEGNMALLRAVEKFDAARGFKFSTYACRAILKSFSRLAGKTTRYKGMFPTEFDPTMERSNEMDNRRLAQTRDAVEELHRIISGNTARLTDVERRVIEARFALNHSTETPVMTLEEVGQVIGVTKERVRQIQKRAMEKLRFTLDEQILR